VAEAVAARSTLSAEEVLGLLAGQAPGDEDELVALAQSLESLRREAGRR
jgi:hypothetical protein